MSDVDMTKIILWVVNTANGGRCPMRGLFLADVDFQARTVQFDGSWEKALTFDSPREAYEFIDQVSPGHQTANGQDYRPLRTWVYGAAPIGTVLMLESLTATKQ